MDEAVEQALAAGDWWSFQQLRRPVAGRSPTAAGHPGKSGRAATPQPPGTPPRFEAATARARPSARARPEP